MIAAVWRWTRVDEGSSEPDDALAWALALAGDTGLRVMVSEYTEIFCPRCEGSLALLRIPGYPWALVRRVVLFAVAHGGEACPSAGIWE